MSAPTRKNMSYVRLGNSGLKVSRLILGMMSYGTPEWQTWVLGEKECTEHVKFAYVPPSPAPAISEGTMGMADTKLESTRSIQPMSDLVYSHGQSEVLLGKAIRELNLPRSEIVIMTKVCNTLGKTYKPMLGVPPTELDQLGYANQYGLSRKHIFDSIKASLERLQLDYVDVLQCHRFDPNTPISETMEALHDVVKAEYARYIGMSSCWAYQFQAMQNYAIANHLTPFISMQNNYSLLYREEEREMMPTLKMFGVGSIPWSPLARGMLGRPFGEKSKRGEVDRMIKSFNQFESDKTVVDRVEEISKKRKVSMAQIAIAWVTSREGELLSCVNAPIIGTTSLENLKDIIGAIDVQLTKEEIDYLSEPYQPHSIIGHR
ncbi:Aryl-alcohol dehydrogenase [Mycena kentingensis (nom. inval.)]|nr:Aryl-alcohol dehydrogenase [Mycena kentingensis (nom. inval.)]